MSGGRAEPPGGEPHIPEPQPSGRRVGVGPAAGLLLSGAAPLAGRSTATAGPARSPAHRVSFYTRSNNPSPCLPRSVWDYKAREGKTPTGRPDRNGGLVSWIGVPLNKGASTALFPGGFPASGSVFLGV